MIKRYLFAIVDDRDDAVYDCTIVRCEESEVESVMLEWREKNIKNFPGGIDTAQFHLLVMQPF
jgi:hypothetical protein